MKNRPVDTELFYSNGRTDRKTDMTKLTVAVRILWRSLQSHLLQAAD